MAEEIAGDVRSDAGIKRTMPGRRKNNFYRVMKLLPKKMSILSETGLFIKRPAAGKEPIAGD